MYNRFSIAEPPAELFEYLRSNLDQSVPVLRRRSVLTLSADGNWRLVCCAVETFPGLGTKAGDAVARSYPRVILYEDWLTAEDCLKLIDDVRNGELVLGEICLKRNGASNWQMQLVPLKNYYMARAGLVVAMQYQGGSTEIIQDPLLSVNAPYYPDLTEAARDWLQFPVYNGSNDARNGEIIFLLPEARALFSGAVLHEGVLKIEVQGNEVETLALIVKGAYWEGASVGHFESAVTDGAAVITIPEDVDRLEYVLMDSNGNVYDFQKETRFEGSGLTALLPTAPHDDLVQQVRTACATGEGTVVEFKPFLEIREKLDTYEKKWKLLELVRTVVAFANTRGGCIYIGVDDDCSVSGMTEGLRRSTRAQVTDDSIRRYCGALTNWVRGRIDTDVPFRSFHVRVDDEFVVILDVAELTQKPAAIHDDNRLYVRAGASNKAVSPKQWESIKLGSLTSTDVFVVHDRSFGE